MPLGALDVEEEDVEEEFKKLELELSGETHHPELQEPAAPDVTAATSPQAGLLRARRKLGSMLGVRRELTKCDWELIVNAPRVHQEMIETRRKFIQGYRKDRWELEWSLDTLVKLIVFVCLGIS
ncbi:hypothetical protein GW17_00053015 [Ensete ventricosum]|nr:hypothetical protein GW17_00053015 [Ensete ventricosum]